MNSSTINRRLLPKKVIVIYNDDNERSNYSSASNYFLECRDIKRTSDKYEIGAPVPLAENVLKDIAMTYMKKNPFAIEFGGLISEHILFGSSVPGRTIVMWYRPSMERVLNFSKSLGIKQKSAVNVPATLYLLINGTMYIYAMMSSERPTLSTKLYNMPFFNVYEDGNICLGSAKVGTKKARTYELEAERFERGFYMAEQNNICNTSSKTPLEKLWAQLIKSKAPFPCKKELIQHKKYKTLADLVNNLIGLKSNNDEEDEIYDEAEEEYLNS